MRAAGGARILGGIRRQADRELARLGGGGHLDVLAGAVVIFVKGLQQRERS